MMAVVGREHSIILRRTSNQDTKLDDAQYLFRDMDPLLLGAFRACI